MSNARFAAYESVYVLPGEISTDAITRSLLALLPNRHRVIARHRFTVLDTFDSRVLRAGACLTRSGMKDAPTVNWQRSASSCSAMRLTGPVSFAWDLPNGALRQQVASVIGPRRLFAQADAEEQGALLEVLDSRSKIVGRVRIVAARARRPTERSPWESMPATVTLTGLRGYDDAYDRLVRVIASRPGVEPCAEGAVASLLRRIGTPGPPDDLGALIARLEPTIGADAGARKIHLALLDVLIANEPGLRANLDSEFLHDFRVAVRRTRSLLGQIRGVFRGDITEHFKTELSWIGRITGPPRDLDVLVLALRRHENLGRDGDALLAFLRQLQQREHEQLVRVLNTDRYQRLLADWKSFLEHRTPDNGEAVHAPDRLAAAVARRAWHLSKRIARQAKSVDGHTAPERLHEIRIDAKKLRYLVDVMPAVTDAPDLKFILGALKKLQRVLGDFNDAHVQEHLMLGCGRAPAAAGASAAAMLTLGRLAEQCRQRRDALRDEALDGLSAFAANGVRKACRRAFKGASLATGV